MDGEKSIGSHPADVGAGTPWWLALSNELAAFDPLDLLQRSAAAQLCPENAKHLLRLEYLSTIAAGLRSNGGRSRMSAGRFRRLLQGGMGVSHLEDPFCGPFTSSLAFFGGAHTVLPGLTEDVRPSVDLLLSAAFLHPDLDDATRFRAATSRACGAILRLSDAACRVAGLQRGQRPIEDGSLTIPSGTRSGTLLRAVTWTNGDLRRVFAGTPVRVQDLEPFESRLGVTLPIQLDPALGPLVEKPLIRDADRLVIGLPHALLTSVSRFLLGQAHDFNLLPRLSRAFHEACVMMVDRCLNFMGLPPVRNPYSAYPRSPTVTEQFRWLDTDKALHVLIVSDDLSTYAPADPFGEASYPVGETLDGCFRAYLDYVRSQVPAVREVLGLVVLCGASRRAVLGFNGGDSSQEVLISRIGDIAALEFLEGNNPQYLWHFAQARRRLRTTTEVQVLSLADELYFYRAHDSSFYMNDEKPPALMVFQPNAGDSISLDAITRVDPHAIRSGANSHQECVRVYPNSSIPAYCPRAPDQTEPAQCVEIADGVIWIRTQRPSDDTDDFAREMACRLVDCVAFWLARMANRPFVNAAAQKHVQIDIRVTDPSQWTPLKSSPAVEPIDVNILVIVVSASRFVASYPPESVQLIGGPSVVHEHAVLRPVLRTVAELAGYPAEDADVAIAETLTTDRHRKFVPITSDDTVAVRQRNLPPCTRVSSAAENVVMDDVARYLASTALSEGLVPRNKRAEVLNDIVAFLYKCLVDELSQLDGLTALKDLLAHNEAIADELSMKMHMEPYTVACFGNDAGPAEEFAEKLTGLYKADLASRFLIELVAAHRFIGSDRMSDTTYDRLLALSSRISNYGMLSDDIQYRTDDPDLKRLASGRLGIGDSRRRDAYPEYLQAFGVGKRASVLREMAGSEAEWVTARRQKVVDAVGAAFVDEFGFSMQQHADFMQAAVWESIDREDAVTTMPLRDLVEVVSKAVGVQEVVAREWLGVLSLRERPDFFAVPAPAKRPDVYPWKFNRAWSYVRRPFIVVGDEVVYGSSHVDRSMAYLRSLCFSGRLKAQSDSMRAAMGMASELNGRRFNHLIVEMFRQAGRYVVRERIEQFVGSMMRGETGPLGDVDLLVVDARRRRIGAYECKDLSMSKTAVEIANEIKELSHGPHSTLAKHMRRIAWLREHTTEVLQELQVDSRGTWEIGGAIIVDEVLISPFLVDMALPVVSLADVEAKLKRGEWV